MQMPGSRCLAFVCPLLAAAALAGAFPPFAIPPDAVHAGQMLEPVAKQPAITNETFTEQWHELESLAESLDAPEYSGLSVRFEPRVAAWSWVVRIRDFRSGSDAAEIAFGEGEVLPPGIYRNVSGVDAVLELDDGGQLVYADQALLYVHGLVGEGGGGMGGGTSVSVTCAAGYYACCNAGPPPTARCYRNTDIHECDAGGLGATSCTVATP